ncbi:MAG TPA: ABC transporter permease subunit [Acidimicrobiia bacterium]
MADLQTKPERPRLEKPPPEPSDGRRLRRPLVVALAIVVGLVVYAIAFEQTNVNLETITSETRQQSLTRILRLLAHPDLVTYDTRESIVAAEVSVPCGAETAPSGRLTVSPSCAPPGGTVSVTGSGFDPRETVVLRFVPDSEFDINLRLAQVTADSAGTFSANVTLPDRESTNVQTIEAVTQKQIGSWGRRVEVFTDANENGVEDDPIVPDSGGYQFDLSGSPDIPAVALVNPTGEIVEFATTGETFEATTGPARGQVAIPFVEALSLDENIRLTGIGEDGLVTVEATPGMDLTGWRGSLYDGATTGVISTSPISDTIALSPRISESVRVTWDKILETVFLALIATTAGLMLAIPLSFVAARNIMREISVTVTNLALVLLAVPLGVAGGILLARGAKAIADPIGENGLGLLIGLIVSIAVTVLLARRGISVEDREIPSRGEKARRGLALALAGAAGLVVLLMLSRLLQEVGDGIGPALGPFGFIGSFFSDVGEILDVALSVIAALAMAGTLANLASRLGYGLRSHSRKPLLQTLSLVLAGVSGAVWTVLVVQIIDWFYQLGDQTVTLVIPAVVGGVLGLLGGWRGTVKGEVEIGLSIYYAARTLFNTLRSIEPLVMAIVFVVWVGIGPFAGSLALALHTAAGLAKLYSEQVESISPGPIEAVRATGANRVQTIVYSVVPQIVPPYISFTMYRWDINVRMSTIIGFVGGGGIGQVLQQNINLLQYRAAAVQMLAIAIVVASMDYASSRLRERFV